MHIKYDYKNYFILYSTVGSTIQGLRYHIYDYKTEAHKHLVAINKEQTLKLWRWYISRQLKIKGTLRNFGTKKVLINVKRAKFHKAHTVEPTKAGVKRWLKPKWATHPPPCNPFSYHKETTRNGIFLVVDSPILTLWYGD